MGMLVFSYFFDRTVVCSLAFSFRMDHYIEGKIVDQVRDVLWSKLSSKHLTVPDHDRFLYTAVKLQNRWNFPNVIGCVDGKHICFKCPTKARSLFYNYKQFFSVVLQDAIDSESRFIFIDIGAFGKQRDGSTFSGSTLYLYTSWKTWDVPYQSLQVLTEVEQKCLSSSLGMRLIL